MFLNMFKLQNMAAILQTTFSKQFPWIRIIVLLFEKWKFIEIFPDV